MVNTVISTIPITALLDKPCLQLNMVPYRPDFLPAPVMPVQAGSTGADEPIKASGRNAVNNLVITVLTS